MENKEFYRRATKVGNSAGVLLPKSLLGAEVKIIIIKLPHDIKKDALKLLEPILENLLGIYIIRKEIQLEKNTQKKDSKIPKIGLKNIEQTEDNNLNKNKKIEILAVSANIQKHFEKENYIFDVVPINVLKKSIKEKAQTREKLRFAKPILNKALLFELKKLAED